MRGDRSAQPVPVCRHTFAVRFSQPLKGMEAALSCNIQNSGRPPGVDQHESGCDPFDSMLSG